VFFVCRGGFKHAENPVTKTTMRTSSDHKISAAAVRAKTAAGLGVFTPCASGASLLKTVPAAVKIAGSNRFLFSDFDQFRDNPQLEAVYLQTERKEKFAPGFLEENFGAKNEPNQTTTTSMKGRISR
jgi:hypothetical protein